MGQQMMTMMQQMMNGASGGRGVIKTGMSGGKGANKKNLQSKRDDSAADPAGSGRVYVRGFDFGTTDEQLEGHMSQAGPIHTVHWITKGSAMVVYKRKASAAKAVSSLDKTTIDGNSRFIDVVARD